MHARDVRIGSREIADRRALIAGPRAKPVVWRAEHGKVQKQAKSTASVPREANDDLHNDKDNDGQFESDQTIVARYIEHEFQRLLDAA